MDYSRFSQWSLIKCNLQNNVCLGMGSPAGEGSSSLLWDGLGQQPGQTAAGLSLLCQPTGSAYWNEWQVWSLILQGYLSQLQVPTCFLYTLRRKDKWDAYWPSFHERNFLMGWHFCPLGVGDKMETCKKYECMCLLGVSGVLQPLWSHSNRGSTEAGEQPLQPRDGGHGWSRPVTSALQRPHSLSLSVESPPCHTLRFWSVLFLRVPDK